MDAMKRPAAVGCSWRTAVVQLSIVRWLLLLQLLSTITSSRADSDDGYSWRQRSASSSSSSQRYQRIDNDLSAIPENCTARQVGLDLYIVLKVLSRQWRSQKCELKCETKICFCDLLCPFFSVLVIFIPFLSTFLSFTLL